MTPAEELAVLKKAIQEHYDQHADDRCWMDDVQLYEAAGIRVDPERFKVGDRAAMLKNCERYVEHRCRDGGPWKSYAELEARIAELEQQNKRWIDNGCIAPPRGEALAGYRCSGCGATGIKLWRESNRCDTLKCAACAAPGITVDEHGRVPSGFGPDTDQLPGGWLPAVPSDKGQYWGYTSVPPQPVGWWRGLPTYSKPSESEDELEVTLDDEEAAHQETLRILGLRDEALAKARSLISNWRVTANVLDGRRDAVHKEMYHRCASELEAAIGRAP